MTLEQKIRKLLDKYIGRVYKSAFEVVEAKDMLYEKLDRLISQDRKELERALLMASQEPEELSQEANHYNWLDGQNETLKAEVERLRDLLDSIEEDLRDNTINKGNNRIEYADIIKSALKGDSHEA